MPNESHPKVVLILHSNCGEKVHRILLISIQRDLPLLNEFELSVRI